MNLIDRLAIFDDRIKQDKKAKEEVVQYRVESIAFNDVFTGLQKNNGYLTKPKFIEMGIEWCSQTGYTQDEMLTRLKNLELDRDYLVNVLAAGPAEQLTVNPPAKYVLERGNVLVVMGSMEALQKLPQN